MTDVTQILAQIERGDWSADEQLFPLVYDELRKLAAASLANEEPGQTLQATALVHEAYLRLVDVETAQHWNSRGHFFAAAAEAMRRILIDRARDKQRLKRGGGRKKLDLDAIEIALNTPAVELLELDEALDKLAAEHQECFELVKLRFFGDLDDSVHTVVARRIAARCLDVCCASSAVTQRQACFESDRRERRLSECPEVGLVRN